MADARRALGRFGEQTAAEHLVLHGYVVVARGWRCRFGEIDLVATKANQIVFVEVRSRRGGNPEESVTLAKRRRLVSLAYLYLQAHNISAETPWRIDVIAIEVGRDGAVARLTHLEHAVGEDEG
jgi:putative endonuclease